MIPGSTQFLKQYFYLFMSVVIAFVVAFGFGQTVSQRLIHPSHAKPMLVSIHAAVFSAWVIFYIVQSALVRTRNVRIHRTLGWFGVGLGIAVCTLGTVTAVVMRRFDLQYPDLAKTAPLLPIALLDMASFTLPFALGIYWRNRPGFHRRLLLIASCALTGAAIARFPDRFHPWPWFYVGVDALILLGVFRDLIVNRSIHLVYRYALPILILAQITIMDSVLHLWP